MERLLFLIVSACLLCSSIRVDAQQIPPYYFDIKEAYSTSLSFESESDKYASKFRVLRIKMKEIPVIVIEHYQRERVEIGKRKLKSYYYLYESDFNLRTLESVDNVKWNSAKEIEITLNGGDCFEVELAIEKELINIERCN